MTTKPRKDYELSKYACYLIVQNGGRVHQRTVKGRLASPDSFLPKLWHDWEKEGARWEKGVAIIE